MKLGNLAKPSAARIEVRKAIAENDSIDAMIDQKQPPETRDPVVESDTGNISGDRKLSRLVENDFPFDESQLDAIEGIVSEQYACMTGAAGTGKTTTTKAIVDRLVEANEFSEVNMGEYFKRGEPEADPDDPAPDSPTPTWVPSVALCAFTGRATQQIKKNFPTDWHGNIMTIHRLLAYVPERYQDWDDESGQMVNKMRFIPTYTADCLLPWDHIVVDEAGMLYVDLWENLWAACKPGCRITFIGDINQLPPVHGKSVFGFAMSQWPTWELRTVHRQQGKDNPIVDNAWRIINGQLPESGGRFQMIPLKGDAQFSSRQVRAMLPALKERGVYDPIRDTCITPINGEDGSRGFALGQLPLNREFAMIFNPDNVNPRFVIDGGRERKQFAVGDKVMATKNDWQAGITNGMTGIITSITENAEYAGEKWRFGTLEEVNANMRDEQPDDFDEFSLDDLAADFEAVESNNKNAKEKKERGPASHVVTVRFGSEEHGFELPFGSLSEVASLMTAYVVTCHKMQGGESPVIIIICHDSHKAMLYREWLYTAVTRASDKCILLYTPTALRTALSKQTIKGRTLKEKVQSFNDIIGRIDVTLPKSQSTRNRVMDRETETFATPARLTTEAERTGGLAQIMKSIKAQPQGDMATETEVRVRLDVRVRKTFTIKTQAAQERVVVYVDPAADEVVDAEYSDAVSLPAPPTYVSTHGAVAMLHKLEDAASQLLLTHTPPPARANPLAAMLKLGVKKNG